MSSHKKCVHPIESITVFEMYDNSHGTVKCGLCWTIFLGQKSTTQIYNYINEKTSMNDFEEKQKVTVDIWQEFNHGYCTHQNFNVSKQTRSDTEIGLPNQCHQCNVLDDLNLSTKFSNPSKTGQSERTVYALGRCKTCFVALVAKMTEKAVLSAIGGPPVISGSGWILHKVDKTLNPESSTKPSFGKGSAFGGGSVFGGGSAYRQPTYPGQSSSSAYSSPPPAYPGTSSRPFGEGLSTDPAYKDEYFNAFMNMLGGKR